MLTVRTIIMGVAVTVPLFVGGAQADDPEPVTRATDRPAPTEIGRFAHPVTINGEVGGQPTGAAFLGTLSPDVREELKRERRVLLGEQKETEDGSYSGLIKAVALFEQPKQRVWELIVDTAMQEEYLPRLDDAEAVWSSAFGELTEFSLGVLWMDVEYRTQHWFYPEYSRVEWSLWDDPEEEWENDIAHQVGFWQLYYLTPNLTIGEYGTKVDTGVAVPQRLQDFFAKKDIPKALEAFQRYIDSDGSWRRDD